MIRRALYQIAGVDRATLETCPATDKVWAAHLGFSLFLSFVVVFGIALHATGYMIADPWLRAAVSLVIALTVFMFDRALYQSDWFYQGFLWQPAAGDEAARGRSARRFLRITIRLAMSFGLAWVIAVFLELAIFSDTISDKIKRDHVAANQGVYQKIERYETELGTEIEARRKSLAALEAVYRDELATPVADAPEPSGIADLEQQIRALDAQENTLRADLRQVLEQIKTYAADMNAEQLGQRLNLNNSGRAGTGPRFQFARQQREVYEAQRTAREAEIEQLRVRRDDLRATHTRMTAQSAARREQARGAVDGKRAALHAQLERARTDLKELEDTRLARVADYRQKALASSDFQKQKDDPLSRMTAYQELKNDPKDGETITLFSWMTKFLVIFLEIVPVVAKLFFSPPSVYAARIQAEVERERRRILRELDGADVPEAAMEPRAPEVVPPVRREPDAGRAASIERTQAVGVRPPNASDSDPPRREPGPSLVPPLREPVTVGIRDVAAQRSSPARDVESERRREMERLVGEEVMRQSGPRSGGRQPAEAGAKLEGPPPSLSFLLQDDIPQKP
jgi:hypothetical protein